MASRRPLAWISGALAELPVGDTVAGHAWYFGSGEPNAAAGAVGEYYVEANNRLWVRGASSWTYTGVQLGSPANVDEKAVLVDADILSIGDSANNSQMRKITVANFKTQFLSTALADAAASPDLPAAGASLPWQSIVQTLRNGLKWLTSRFNSAGQLAPAYGGTGTNDLANLPISVAALAELDLRIKRGPALDGKGPIDAAINGIFRVNDVSSGYQNQGLTFYGTLFGLFGTSSDTCAQMYFNYDNSRAFVRGGITSGSNVNDPGLIRNKPWLSLATDNFRTLPGGVYSTGDSSQWVAVGTIYLSQSQTARITILGTQGYGDTEACSGESIIHLRRTNDSLGVGISGHHYAHSDGNATILGAALLPLGNQKWRVFVRPTAYQAVEAMCETNGSFQPENGPTGSGDQPSGSILLPARWNLMIGGLSYITAEKDVGVTFKQSLFSRVSSEFSSQYLSPQAYRAAIFVGERNRAGVQNYDPGAAPRVAWYWSGVGSYQITCDSEGLSVVDEAGTSGALLKVGALRSGNAKINGSLNISSGGGQWFSVGASIPGASYGAFYKGGTTALVGLLGTDGGGAVGGGSGDNFVVRASAHLILTADEGVVRPAFDGTQQLGADNFRWARIATKEVACSGPVSFGQYTLSTLPSASAYSGYYITVTDAAGCPKLCRSNGSAWQIANTTSTVS